MKVNKYHLINIILLCLLITTFFFHTIAVPVENIEGAKDTEHFIFGGFYWTSVLYQLDVGNYFGSFLYGLIFLVLFSENYLIFKRGDKI